MRQCFGDVVDGGGKFRFGRVRLIDHCYCRSCICRMRFIRITFITVDVVKMVGKDQLVKLCGWCVSSVGNIANLRRVVDGKFVHCNYYRVDSIQ